jgi:PKHD-type hydroxylase
VRTDISSTLFLSDPDEYEGGELVVEDSYGAHRVKHAAGDLVLYPGTSHHHVTPVTARHTTGGVLLDAKPRSFRGRPPQPVRNGPGDPDPGRRAARSPSVAALTGVYHNLLRRWSQP